MDKSILSFFLIIFSLIGTARASQNFIILEGDIEVKKTSDNSSFLRESVNYFYPFKFNFDLKQIDLDFEQNGKTTTFISLKTTPEIIKSITSVSYKINDTDMSNDIETWDNNFRYNFETKKGKNIIHATFNLKDGSKEEADFTYFYTGRKLSVDCRFQAIREVIDFSVPISYVYEKEEVESRDLRDYFANAVAIFNPSTNTMDLKMVVGREGGLIRREQKAEEIFTIIENETNQVEIDKASLSCAAVNQEL